MRGKWIERERERERERESGKDGERGERDRRIEERDINYVERGFPTGPNPRRTLPSALTFQSRQTDKALTESFLQCGARKKTGKAPIKER